MRSSHGTIAAQRALSPSLGRRSLREQHTVVSECAVYPLAVGLLFYAAVSLFWAAVGVGGLWLVSALSGMHGTDNGTRNRNPG